MLRGRLIGDNIYKIRYLDGIGYLVPGTEGTASRRRPIIALGTKLDNPV